MILTSKEFLLGESEVDYFRSDYLSVSEQESEAEVPVPDRLLPKRLSQELAFSLKLSQQIGILLWLNRVQLISIGGRQRLLYLQEKASFEAISAGLKFAERLSKEKKLQSDFKHAARELNRRPQSKRFRVREKNRIGVGYRDKGTCPDVSAQAQRKADSEAMVHLPDLPEELQELILKTCPVSVVDDWVDLSEIRLASADLQKGLTQLATPL